MKKKRNEMTLAEIWFRFHYASTDLSFLLFDIKIQIEVTIRS